MFYELYPLNNEIKGEYNGLQHDIKFGQIDTNSGSENTSVKFYNITNFKLVKLSTN